MDEQMDGHTCSHRIMWQFFKQTHKNNWATLMHVHNKYANFVEIQYVRFNMSNPTGFGHLIRLAAIENQHHSPKRIHEVILQYNYLQWFCMFSDFLKSKYNDHITHMYRVHKHCHFLALSIQSNPSVMWHLSCEITNKRARQGHIVSSSFC